MDTNGFYKSNLELLYAPNFVYAPAYSLIIKDKSKYVYPIDGWEWFGSEELAATKYGIKLNSVRLKKLKEAYKDTIPEELYTAINSYIADVEKGSVVGK